MRIALLSDIHTNSTAFQKVLDDARSRGAEAVWGLGDVVGYGGDPRECIGLVRKHFTRWVCGNHEKTLRIVANMLCSTEMRFDGQPYPQAWQSICARWPDSAQRYEASQKLDIMADSIKKHYENLLHPEEDRSRIEVYQALMINSALYPGADLGKEADALRAAGKDDWNWFYQQICKNKYLEEVPDLLGARVILSHGSPNRPESGYLYPWSGWSSTNGTKRDWDDLNEYLLPRAADGKPLLAIFGHSHIPLYSAYDPKVDPALQDLTRMEYDTPLPLSPWITLINPGSVGHPSDGDKRASYALLDLEQHTVTYIRLRYMKMEKATQIAKNYVSKSVREEFSGALARISDTDPQFEDKNNLLKARLSAGGGA